MANCLHEAVLQKIERECGCSSIEYQSAHNFTLPICAGEGKHCMLTTLAKVGEDRTFVDPTGVRRQCYVACDDQRLEWRLSSLAYPSPKAFHTEALDFCLVLKKVRRSCLGDRRPSLDEAYPELCPAVLRAEEPPEKCAGAERYAAPTSERLRSLIAGYARENVVDLRVFFSSAFARGEVRDERVSRVGLVGSVGGILGLFLGFSFISLAEVFYFIMCYGKRGGGRKVRVKNEVKSRGKEDGI